MLLFGCNLLLGLVGASKKEQRELTPPSRRKDRPVVLVMNGTEMDKIPNPAKAGAFGVPTLLYA
jgi:hypothetical protein